MAHEMREENGVVILTLEGKIMGSPQDTALTGVVEDLIEKNKLNVIFDFCNVDWMNSRGLGICIACSSALKSKGGSLKLACACDKVKDLLEKCKMYAVLECYNTLPEAVASFA
jgi:anti-anti-sigma factor